MRVDTKVKRGARLAFRRAGLDLSSGIRLYLNRVAQTGKVFENLQEEFVTQGSRDILAELGNQTLKDYEYYERL